MNFSKSILDIDDGTSEGIKDTENEDATWIRIPEKYLVQYESNPIEKISHIIYNDFIQNFDDINYLKQRAIVAPKIKQSMKLINIFYH